MFGTTGILQNHRAVLKFPSQPPLVTTVQLTVPDSVPRDVKNISTWLQQELGLAKPFERFTRNAPQTVTFGEKKLTQTERFQLIYRSPTEVVQAEYLPESGSVTAKRNKPGLMGVIENLHRANGVGVAWVLLSDSMGGCLIILSLTGVLLWTELERRKMIGACIFFASVATIIGVVTATL